MGPTWVRYAVLAAFGAAVGLGAGSERRTRTLLAESSGLTLNGWDVILASLCDPYLLCYLGIPLFLFGFSSMLQARCGPEEMVRHGSRTAAVGALGLTGFGAVLPFLTVWVVVASVISVGLKWEWGWSSAAAAGLPALDLATTAMTSLGSPVVALALQLVLLLLSAWAGAMVCATTRLWSSGNRWLRWTCVALALWTIVTFNVPDALPAPLRLVAYVDLAFLVRHLDDVGLAMASIVAVGCLVLAGNAVVERLGRSFRV